MACPLEEQFGYFKLFALLPSRSSNLARFSRGQHSYQISGEQIFRFVASVRKCITRTLLWAGGAFAGNLVHHYSRFTYVLHKCVVCISDIFIKGIWNGQEIGDSSVARAAPDQCWSSVDEPAMDISVTSPLKVFLKNDLFSDVVCPLPPCISFLVVLKRKQRCYMCTKWRWKRV